MAIRFLEVLDWVLALAELPAAVLWWPVVWLTWLAQFGRKKRSQVEAQLGTFLAFTLFLPLYALLRTSIACGRCEAGRRRLRNRVALLVRPGLAIASGLAAMHAVAIS